MLHNTANRICLVYYTRIQSESSNFPPTGFINKKDEYICYINSTFKVQYFNVIFRQLIMNIDCDLILKNLDFDDNNSASNYQKELILQYLQNIFGHMCIDGQKTLITEHLFIVAKIRVNNQMYAS